MPDTNTLANLFAQKLIARPNVKAQQASDGSWYVHTTTRKHDGPRIPWRRQDLVNHIEGRETFGHYLLSEESQVKLFAFDVDLEKSGHLPEGPYFSSDEEPSLVPVEDLRGAWLNRAHPSRDYMKYQFKMIAHELCRAIIEELNLPCAVAYSGGKGIHVYCFTGLLSAQDARLGSRIVLDSLEGMKPVRGDNFFKTDRYPNLSIECFPKQDSLDGKDLGNLMRLPLGRNLKSTDPTFFIDMSSPLAEFRPIDPILALSMDNPFNGTPAADPWSA